MFSANGSGQGPVNGLLYSPGAQVNPVRATFTTQGSVIANDPVPLTNSNGEPDRIAGALDVDETGVARG